MVYLTYILHFLIVILFFMKKAAIASFNFAALSIGLSGELIDKSESESPFHSNKPSPNWIGGTLL